MAPPALAQEQAIAFDIPPQPLSGALNAYAQAARRQILFSDGLVRDKQSAGLSGRYEPTVALERLLDGSDLTWRRSRGGAVLIERAAVPSPQTAAAAVNATADATAVDGLVVVGSRLARKTEGPAPVVIVGEAEIEQLGAASLGEVLQYLPQQSFTTNDWLSPSGSRRAQLRGLGVGTTLVLINGRRTVPGSLTAASNGFDLNRIPLPAVERIEILAESASAIYGADAVGGVVNIVLKTDVDGVVLEGSYGAADGGAEERRASVTVGGRSARARGVLTFDVFDRDPLLGAARSYIGDADYRRFGATDRRVPRANPGNICAASGNLPGVGAPCAAVPAGSSGIGLSPASFLPTAGQRNLDSPNRYSSYVAEQRRYSVSGAAEIDLADDLAAFAELTASDSTVRDFSAPPSITNALVPASNPFNPFGVPVRADFLIRGIGPAVNEGNETDYRVTAGLKGKRGGFDWEVSGLVYRSDGDNEARGFTDAARVTAALAATAPDQALNPFQDGPGGSPALLASLLRDPSTNRLEAKSGAYQVAGFIRGDLLDLPAGPLAVVVGGEWRHERIALEQPGAGLSVSADTANRDSAALYGEARVPLLDSGSLGSFAVTLAGRLDDYSDFGRTFNAQYGAEWRPLPSLLVRGSYGESYRAPGLYELYQPARTLTSTFIDPRRGGQSTVGSLLLGGNPDLQAETSTSGTVGVVWTPDAPGRPRLSATLWRIDQDRRVVTGFSSATLLANEVFFPERVRRAAPTAADVAAGRPGLIELVDTRLLNLGRLTTDGLDLEANAAFRTDFGDITPVLRATYVHKYDAADFQSTPVRERAGVADTTGSIPRWRVTGSLTWRREAVQVSTTARWISSYDDVTSANVRTGERVEDQLLIDAQVAIELNGLMRRRGGAAGDATLRLGVINLFDKAPPYSNVRNTGFDPSQGDVRQRFFYAAVSKRF